MNDLKFLTNDNIKKLIDETESTLSELKSELEYRDEQSQQREIANLDNHMKSAELSLKSIREFLNYLIEDIRDEKNNRQ